MSNKETISQEHLNDLRKHPNYFDYDFLFPGEEWKAVPEWEGIYEVSNWGRLRSVPRVADSGFPVHGKIRSSSPDRNGYLKSFLCVNGSRKMKSHHRLVCSAFIGDGLGMEANHISGIKTDNRLVNLEWVTRSENMRHAYKEGLNFAHIGESNPRSKLCDESVVAMRAKWDTGLFSMADLSREFGVAVGQIKRALSGETWSHLQLVGNYREHIGKVTNHVNGERSPRSKLTKEDVMAIRKMRSQGAHLKEIAKKFGVTFGLIGHIVNRRIWKHVK